jgi:membrane fusion protein (multidrug efflux system)
MDARRSVQFQDAALNPAPAINDKGPQPGDKSTPAAVAPKKPNRRRLLAGLLLVALGAGGVFGWRWWTVGQYQITTDNAYLNADKVTIAPRIAGYVAQALVADNQAVRRGDTLALIDDREYRVALASAQADADKAQADLLGVGAALAQQQAQVESARADLDNAEAALTFAQQEYNRYQNLLQTGAGSAQRQQQAQADLRQRQAGRDKAKATLDAAQQQIESLKAQQSGARATLDAARAKVDQAKLNLDYTKIVAPIDGVVGDRSLRMGQYVTPGTNLLTIVPMGADIYLVANFKETQTTAMKVGQDVAFTLDAFGNHEFRGRVESFSPGTGAQFALLPPENATGNFTKIVQRVPVRIALDASDPLIDKLRPGLSAEARVNTRPATDQVKEAALR